MPLARDPLRSSLRTTARFAESLCPTLDAHVKIFLSDGDSAVPDQEILSIHTDTFNRALKEQDYIALEGLYVHGLDDST